VCHDSAVAHDRAAGAPVDEIEITPEMIEAGASAACACLGCGELYAPMTEEKMAIEVFLAMDHASFCACID
jgi:hypothetical protein